MARVFIGVDPHKLSATIEVVDERETVLAKGRFGSDKVGYPAMRKKVAPWPERTWAVEGSNGAGRSLAQRLLADGERVVDVPAKLSARARLFDTGHNRKTDAHDAHAVAVVAVRTRTLRVLAYDEQLKLLVLERGSSLMDLTGVGPVVAARILADVGDVARFASWTGTAPIEASSGEQVRHRLSRAGNRKANHVIHIAAACQIRLDTAGRAYYRRKLAAGKSPLEAMRCLKRRISDAIYRQLVLDARAVDATDATEAYAGPGGQGGASQISSAAGSNPHTDASDQPLPGPAPTTLPAPTPTRKPSTSRPLQPAT